MNLESTNPAGTRGNAASGSVPEWLQVVRSQVDSLKFGTVQITVHDSTVVQIDRLEKIRLDRKTYLA